MEGNVKTGLFCGLNIEFSSIKALFGRQQITKPCDFWGSHTTIEKPLDCSSVSKIKTRIGGTKDFSCYFHVSGMGSVEYGPFWCFIQTGRQF